MKQIIKSNEEKIFDSIQELKDSIFGLKNSYVNYCYSESNTSLYWDNKKSEDFIQELLGFAKNNDIFEKNFEELIVMAFELSLKFILYACNFEEQRFVSLRKIIYTMKKSNNEEQSVFEIMVENQKEYFDFAYLEECETFCQKIIEVDFDAIYKCCKHAIESFIDTKHLNSISNEKATADIVLRINRLSNIITTEMRHYAEVNGVYDNE